MAVPQDRKYAKSHEWIRIDGDTAYVGISDYAQEELGDVVFVEMPDVDDQVKNGDEVATVESVKASSPIYAPISGTVSAVNEELEDKPELLNQKPYEAWLFTLSDFDESGLAGLLDADAYEKHIEQEKSGH